MIQDAADLDEGTVLRAEICIVGAGAAGIAIALALLGSGRSVLVLEGGGERVEPAAQALYEGEVADPALHSPPVRYRQRRFGGTTGIWGGRCVPFDAIDFERREWLPESGWPFGSDELLPHYAEANRLLEAGEFAYTTAEAFPARPGRPALRPMLRGFAGRRFDDDTLERFSCPTDLSVRYRRRLEASAGVRVMLHANVTKIATSEDGGHVERLDVRTPSGRALHVRADQFVLAAGGLEIPRLLLASRSTGHPNGVGNGHDLVGRYYMCHIAGTTGRLEVAGGRDAAWHGYDLSDEGVYCRRRLRLTAAAQAELGTGSFAARLHHPHIPDPSHRTGVLSALYLAKPLISYEYGKRLVGERRATLAEWLAHVRNVALDPWNTGVFLHDWVRRRSLAERKLPSVIVRSRAGTFSLEVIAEQQPNRSSRVTLSDARDALGMPRLRVDWRHEATDIDTVRRALAALAEDVAESGCGRLSCDDAAVEAEMLRDGAFGGHHIGTTRMSASPRRGVVDADCKVHGLANLHVASSAVFPTSSHANPTLTIVAMALRLAARLGRPPVPHDCATGAGRAAEPAKPAEAVS